MAPKLRLLNLLKEGKTALATFALLRTARTAQVLSNLDLDAVIVDCEHGNASDTDMHDMVAVIAASGTSPVIRVPGMEGTVLKRAIDTGTHGIIVPMVENAKDAQSIVHALRFPPLGRRGQGSPFAFLSWGLETQQQYISQANNSILIIAQIETVSAVENIDEICSVDGIDLLLIGPNDLALSVLGYCPAKGTERAYLEAIESIKASTKKWGKKIGIVTTDGANASRLKEEFDLVVLTADIRALQAWYKAEVAVARS